MLFPYNMYKVSQNFSDTSTFNNGWHIYYLPCSKLDVMIEKRWPVSPGSNDTHLNDNYQHEKA